MSKNRTNVSIVVAIVLMLSVAVLVAVRQAQSQPADPPANYKLLAEADLNSGPFAGTELADFVVAETAVTHLHLSLQNLDTPAFALSLQGEDGRCYSILQAENYRTDGKGGGDWQETLPPGVYRLVLDAAPGPGSLGVYLLTTPVSQ